jgi:RHS repeat-associated protein
VKAVLVSQDGITASYIYPDQVDTPRMITRPSDNQMVWRWDQTDPFGSATPNQNPSSLGTFVYNPRFPGQLFDSEDNLNYNYFRNYDPTLGRYVQSDPLGLGAGVNTYSYTQDIPTKYSDPRGLAGDSWWRPCNEDQVDACMRQCESGGKEFGSCAQRWGTYTGIRDGKPVTMDKPGGVSCSCKDKDPMFKCGGNCQKVLRAVTDALTGLLIITVVVICAPTPG